MEATILGPVVGGILWVGGSILVGEAFRAKKRSFIYGFFISAFFSPFLGVLVAASSKNPDDQNKYDFTKDYAKIEELKIKYDQKSTEELKSILINGGRTDRAIYVINMILNKRAAKN